MKHIIFDFDGTLVNSLPVALEILHEIMPSVHINDEELAKLRNMSSRQIVKYSGIPYWRLPRLLIRGKKILSNRLDELKLFKGMAGVLKDLHQAGYQLSVVSSNSEENIRQVLAREGVEDYFSGVYGNVGLFNKARVFRVVRRDQQALARETIYVGDETRDIEAARRARQPVIAITWGYNGEQILAKYHPNYIADTPAKLLQIITNQVK